MKRLASNRLAIMPREISHDRGSYLRTFQDRFRNFIAMLVPQINSHACVAITQPFKFQLSRSCIARFATTRAHGSKAIVEFAAPRFQARARRNINAAKTAKWNLLRSRQAVALPVLYASRQTYPAYVRRRYALPRASTQSHGVSPDAASCCRVIYTVSVVTLSGP